MTIDTTGWSIEAWRMHKSAASAHAAYQARMEGERERMLPGPHLADDGHTLIVPSEWYDERLVAIWNQYGFSFNKAESIWTRDTRTPHQRQRYTADAWVKFARARFYEVWRSLLKRCVRCNELFVPTNAYLIRCPECRALERDAAQPKPEPEPEPEPEPPAEPQPRRCTRCQRPVIDEHDHLCPECCARGYL